MRLLPNTFHSMRGMRYTVFENITGSKINKQWSWCVCVYFLFFTNLMWHFQLLDEILYVFWVLMPIFLAFTMITLAERTITGGKNFPNSTKWDFVWVQFANTTHKSHRSIHFLPNVFRFSSSIFTLNNKCIIFFSFLFISSSF